MTQLVYANFNVLMYNEHSKGLNSSISILLTHYISMRYEIHPVLALVVLIL